MMKHVLSFGDGFSSFGLDGLMNRSAAETSTIDITNCSKPLFHHQFYVVVGQNLVFSTLLLKQKLSFHNNWSPYMLSIK